MKSGDSWLGDGRRTDGHGTYDITAGTRPECKGSASPGLVRQNDREEELVHRPVGGGALKSPPSTPSGAEGFRRLRPGPTSLQSGRRVRGALLTLGPNEAKLDDRDRGRAARQPEMSPMTRPTPEPIDPQHLVD